jgi:L-xylulokinase
VRPAVLATDSRAHAESAVLCAGAAGTRALELTGQVPLAGSPASIITWVRAHEPDVWARTRWVLFCKDWLRLRLTGDVATDPSEAGAAFSDVRTQRWSEQALTHLGLADVGPRLPPIRPSAEVVAEVSPDGARDTGLRAGTPVVTGAHDVDAAAVGIGAVQLGAASVVLGTWSINQVLADAPATDRRWQTRAFVEPGRWLHMSTSPAGAAALDWAVRRTGPSRSDGEPDPAAAVDEARAAAGRPGAPLFLPFLHGAPFGGQAAGTWLGLRGWHGRGDLLHAVLEGVCFTHRDHLDALRERFAVRQVRVCGGGARSGYWTQLLADVLDLPVEVTDAHEAGARGAAMLAGVGVGHYAGVAEAAERAVRVVRRCAPDAPAVARRAARYEVYRAAVEAVTGVSERLAGDPGVTERPARNPGVS